MRVICVVYLITCYSVLKNVVVNSLVLNGPGDSITTTDNVRNIRKNQNLFLTLPLDTIHVVFIEGCRISTLFLLSLLKILVRYSHGGGGSRKINAWHIYTLMVYL
jgi:hypothetical protein